MTLFSVSSVRCAAGDRTILDIPRLRIGLGAHLLLQGPSGSGKTTLMSVLAGLRRPDVGTVLFRDQDLAAQSDAALDKLRGQRFGFVMQGLHLVCHLSVAENLALARYAAGLPADASKIQSILARLNIAALSSTRAGALSTGEAQRVAVARALINNPEVIFADEPTSALDDHNAKLIIDLLIEQARLSQAALIVASHDARIKNHFSDVLPISAGQVAV